MTRESSHSVSKTYRSWTSGSSVRSRLCSTTAVVVLSKEFPSWPMRTSVLPFANGECLSLILTLVRGCSNTLIVRSSLNSCLSSNSDVTSASSVPCCWSDTSSPILILSSDCMWSSGFNGAVEPYSELIEVT